MKTDWKVFKLKALPKSKMQKKTKALLVQLDQPSRRSTRRPKRSEEGGLSFLAELGTMHFSSACGRIEIGLNYNQGCAAARRRVQSELIFSFDHHQSSSS